VYGSSVGGRARHEDDPAIPDEPYGACKRAIEVVGETLAKNRALQFVSLRIARVVGPGAKTTSSPWRSQMLDPGKESIILPFAREAELSLVHVHDVARMLLILAEAEEIRDVVYNTPAEMWRVGQLQAAIQKFTGARVKVEPGKVQAGPTCDGRRFAREFGFRSAGLEEQLKAAGQASHSARHAPGR
jgi:nucleoside-diphosphate-sugar epimerase